MSSAVTERPQFPNRGLRGRLRGRSELGVAGLLGAAGTVVLVDALRLSAPYSQSDPLGPKAVRVFVGGLLLLSALLLAIDVLRGGHGEAEEAEDVDLTAPTEWRFVLPL